MPEQETVESYWRAELDEDVEIVEVPEFDEFDIKIGGSFAITVANMEQAEAYLARYACVRDFSIGQVR